MSGRVASIMAGATLVGLFGLGWYADYVAHQELTAAVKFLILTATAVGLLLLIIITLAVSLIGWEHWQSARATRQGTQAQAQEAQTRAEVMVVQDGQGGVFIRELNPRAKWRAAHLDPHIVANGVVTTPTPLELAAWQMWTLRNSHNLDRTIPATIEAPALAPPSLPEQVNLLNLLTTGSSLERIVLGVTANETGLEVVTAPLYQLVHIAIGGSSGWGKSMLLRALAFQLVTAPELCQLAFIDLEGITFAPFAQSDRLRYTIADTEQTALAVLADLVGEMNRRRELFNAYPGCDSLNSYNALAAQPLPTITLMVDESTALLSDKAVETALRTLTLRARKFGLYAILGGQDWKASSLDTAIRNQLSSRIHFKAQDGAQSRVLLGTPDAALIDRPGRAYAIIPGRSRLELQAPFISMSTITRNLPPTNQVQSPPPPPPQPGPTLTEQELIILEMAEQEESKAAICKALGWTPGGKQYQLIDEVLRRHDRI